MLQRGVFEVDLDLPHESTPESSTRGSAAGLVEQVTYHNTVNGFSVLRASARGHRDVVTVHRYAATISADDPITASGEWVNDRTHGQQFKARFLRTSPPTSADGIEIPLVRHDPGRATSLRKKFVRAFVASVRSHRDHPGSAPRGRRHRAGSRGQHLSQPGPDRRPCGKS